MNSFQVTLNGASLHATGTGTLLWPALSLLCVSDLHLGKSERLARRGGPLLPPYETDDTIQRLADEISRHKPRTVICLGDSFDDTEAATGLAPAHRDQLSFLMTGRTWIWIAGNHDPVPMDLGGEAATDHKLGPLTFRHCSDGQTSGEVSGHYHPKVTLRTAAGAISRRCFLLDRHRLILPAFGTYTGGLRSSDATLRALMKEDASAILTGPRVRAIPMSCL